MADELSSSDIRARRFGSARRGFDRSEVTSFLDRVAGRVGALEGELADISVRVNQLGITDLPNLKEELEDFGVEIQAVIDAAMAAAEGMRARASADAEAALADADEASRNLRGDAWSAGDELLRQAAAESARLVAEAREDALFIRAEAEQEAKRLVGDARRQGDDFVRASRDEGERIVVVAKAESEAILDGARQSAEKAQERARALENRRSELLSELEAAESAIRDIESTRTEREKVAETGVRVIASGAGERTHWPEDEGAVRILPAVAPQPAPEPAPPEPVDAEAMAAEVEQMRSAVTMPQPAEPVTVDPEAGVDEPPAPIEEEIAEPEPHVAVEPQGEAPSESESGQEAEVSVARSAAEPEKESRAREESDAGPPVAEASVTEGPHVEDKVTIVQDAPDIDALFAKLRQPVEPEPVSVPEPVTEVESAAAAEPDREEEGPQEPPPPVLQVVPPLEIADGFERRDRMLLPIENRGLRGLKRRIVELQNRVLEELRTSSGEWRLGRGFVIQMMGDELDGVLLDSYRAGHAAAAETIGKTEPQLTGGPEQGAAELFTADLHRDVQAVLGRGSAAGSRRLSSDVGRVFRSWRTDEAERHVRQAARRAFNDGLLAGYGRLGVPAVEIAAPGRPCGACAAESGISWAPAEEIPDGVAVPPVDSSCAAMVVPAEAGGLVSVLDQ